MSSLSAVIIGCGNIAGGYNNDPLERHALTHAKAYELHPDTTLVACCDADAKRAAAFADRWGCERWYTDAAEMLAAEAAQMVSVCVPTEVHLQVAIAIAGAPVAPAAILLEKPVAHTLSAANETVRVLAATRAVCNMNYLRRFVPELRTIQSRLFAGEWGAPVAYRGLYTKGLANNGTHMIDLLRWLLGSAGEPTVIGVGEGLGADKTVSWAGSFGNVPGVVQGLCEDAFAIFEADVFCERATVRILDFGNRVEFALAEQDPMFPGYRALGAPTVQSTELADGVLYFVDNTVAALRGEAEALCPLTEGVADMRAVERIAERARQ